MSDSHIEIEYRAGTKAIWGLWLLLSVVALLNHRALFADGSLAIFNLLHFQELSSSAQLFRPIDYLVQAPFHIIFEIFGRSVPVSIYLAILEFVYLFLPTLSLYLTWRWTRKAPVNVSLLLLAANLMSQLFVFSFANSHMNYSLSFLWPLLALLSDPKGSFTNRSFLVLGSVLIWGSYEPGFLLLFFISLLSFNHFRKTKDFFFLFYTGLNGVGTLFLLIHLLGFKDLSGQLNEFSLFPILHLYLLFCAILVLVNPVLFSFVGRGKALLRALYILGLSFFSSWFVTIFYNHFFRPPLIDNSGSPLLFLLLTLSTCICLFFLARKSFRRVLSLSIGLVLLFGVEVWLIHFFRGPAFTLFDFFTVKFFGLAIAGIVVALFLYPPFLMAFEFEAFKRVSLVVFVCLFLTFAASEFSLNKRWAGYLKDLAGTMEPEACTSFPLEKSKASGIDGNHEFFLPYISILIQKNWSPRSLVFPENKEPDQQACNHGFPIGYYRFSSLVNDLKIGSKTSMIRESSTGFNFRFVIKEEEL